MTEVFHVAADILHIAGYLSPEDVMSSTELEERCLMAYIGEFFLVNRTMKAMPEAASVSGDVPADISIVGTSIGFA